MVEPARAVFLKMGVFIRLAKVKGKNESTQQETLVEEELKQEFMDIPIITEEVFRCL